MINPTSPTALLPHLVVPAHHPDLAALRVQQVKREEAALAARIGVPAGAWQGGEARL